MGVLANFSVLGCLKVEEDDGADILRGRLSNGLDEAEVVLAHGHLALALGAVELFAVVPLFSLRQLSAFLADFETLAY